MKIFQLTIIVLIFNICSIVFPQEKLGYSLKEIFSISGQELIKDKFSIVRISDLAVSGNGNIFILDMGNQCIYEFDKYGNFRVKIGREGKGPGELVGAHKLELIYNSSIIVVDNGARRFTIYDTSGAYQKIMRFPNTINIVKDFRVDSGNNIIIESIDYKIKNKEMITRTVLTKFDENLIVVDKVDSSNYYKQRMFFKKRKAWVRFPFPDKLVWELLTNGHIIVGKAHSNKINLYDQKNNKKSFTIRTTQKVITESNKKEYFADHEFLQDNGVWSKGAPEDVQTYLKFPSYFPLFNSFINDTKVKHVLLQTFYGGEKETNYIEYTYSGKFIKDIKLPKKYFNYTTIIIDNHLYYYIQSGGEFTSFSKFLIKR